MNFKKKIAIGASILFFGKSIFPYQAKFSNGWYIKDGNNVIGDQPEEEMRYQKIAQKETLEKFILENRNLIKELSQILNKPSQENIDIFLEKLESTIPSTDLQPEINSKDLEILIESYSTQVLQNLQKSKRLIKSQEILVDKLENILAYSATPFLEAVKYKLQNVSTISPIVKLDLKHAPIINRYLTDSFSQGIALAYLLSEKNKIAENITAKAFVEKDSIALYELSENIKNELENISKEAIAKATKTAGLLSLLRTYWSVEENSKAKKIITQLQKEREERINAAFPKHVVMNFPYTRDLDNDGKLENFIFTHSDNPKYPYELKINDFSLLCSGKFDVGEWRDRVSFTCGNTYVWNGELGKLLKIKEQLEYERKKRLEQEVKDFIENYEKLRRSQESTALKDLGYPSHRIINEAIMREACNIENVIISSNIESLDWNYATINIYEEIKRSMKTMDTICYSVTGEYKIEISKRSSGWKISNFKVKSETKSIDMLQHIYKVFKGMDFLLPDEQMKEVSSLFIEAISSRNFDKARKLIKSRCVDEFLYNMFYRNSKDTNPEKLMELNPYKTDLMLNSLYHDYLEQLYIIEKLNPDWKIFDQVEYIINGNLLCGNAKSSSYGISFMLCPERYGYKIINLNLSTKRYNFCE